jgi:hypothetical protein
MARDDSSAERRCRLEFLIKNKNEKTTIYLKKGTRRNKNS